MEFSYTITSIDGLFVVALSLLVGFEVIKNIPAVLHTPLMSGSNAISGIILIGGIIQLLNTTPDSPWTMAAASLAVLLGTVVLVAAENPDAMADALTIEGVAFVEPDTDPLRLRLHLDGDHHTPDVVGALVARGVRLTRVEPLEPSLEDLYFAVRTKKPIADDGGRQLTPTGDEALVTDRHRQVAALTGWPGSEDAR